MMNTLVVFSLLLAALAGTDGVPLRLRARSPAQQQETTQNNTVEAILNVTGNATSSKPEQMVNASKTAPADGPYMHTDHVAKLLMRQQDLRTAASVNFFDPRVFDPVYYKKHNAELASMEDFHGLRQHWVDWGVRKGLRASPNFSARIYLQKNADVRDKYGVDNYPWAVIHYLSIGVNETWRATGGPERINIYDPRVFDWKWYLEHHGLTQYSFTTEKQARDHWRMIGLDTGLEGGPNIHLAAYLKNNPDLQNRYGEKNYRAALSYFVHKGYKETWRDPGGRTCRFWSTWCHAPHSISMTLLAMKQQLPKYNLTGAAPVARRAGHSLEVNGKHCSEYDETVPQTDMTTRVAETVKLHFPGVPQRRSCDTTVRHYTDVQSAEKTQNTASVELANWKFPSTAPKVVVDAPFVAPPNYLYRGYQWLQRPDTDPSSYGDTYSGRGSRLEALYTIKATRNNTAPVENVVYSIAHHFTLAPNASFGEPERNSDGSHGLVREMIMPDVNASNLPANNTMAAMKSSTATQSAVPAKTPQQDVEDLMREEDGPTVRDLLKAGAII